MIAFTDGACRQSNPGLAASSWVLYDGIGLQWKELHNSAVVHSGLNTNNYAEYQGLLMLLHYLDNMTKFTGVTIYSDSQLVVKQVNREWGSKPPLASYADTAYTLLLRGGHTLKHMRGHNKDERIELHFGNDRADLLCNQVLDEYQERN